MHIRESGIDVQEAAGFGDGLVIAACGERQVEKLTARAERERVSFERASAFGERCIGTIL